MPCQVCKRTIWCVWCMRLIDVQMYGYSRSSDTGEILNYHRIYVANTLHCSSGSGNNTDVRIACVYEAD